MPQAERPFKADIVVAVPSRGNCRIEWAQMLNTLEPPVGMSWMVRTLLHPACDEARNAAVIDARKSGAQWLLFLDDDTLLPNHSIRRMVYLMEQHPDWDLLSGVYVTKSDPPQPLIFTKDKGGPAWDWKFNTQFPIKACGMGACLIRMSAFDKVEEPWFRYVQRAQGMDHFEEGEDVYFCRKLTEAGGVLMADGGLLCGHINPNGKVFSIPFDSRPIQSATKEEMENFTMLDASHTHEKAAA